MPEGEYRVTVNGFRVMAETWDDAFEYDGKHDEVFLSTSVTVLRNDGTTSYQNQPTSPVMGDTNSQNGRVRAGSASARGGLITGDSFPTKTPWTRSAPISAARDYPPCAVWRGTLVQGENVALISPTLWEWDPGTHFFQGWIDWAARTAAEIKPQLAELLGPLGGASNSVVRATSLGLDLATSLFAGGPIGSSGSRPIGLKSDPGRPNKFDFDPYVLLLNYDTAEELVNSEPSGRGPGLLTLRYLEHPWFRGDYLLYVQVERMSAPPAAPAGRAVALRSMNFPDRVIRHRDFVGWLEPAIDAQARADSSFVLEPGLSQSGHVSLLSTNIHRHYLRHQGFEIRLQAFEDTPLYRQDATFRRIPGLADPGAASFESVNYPGRFIRHRDFKLFLDPPGVGAGTFAADATFSIVDR